MEQKKSRENVQCFHARVKEPEELIEFLSIHFAGKSRSGLKSMLSKGQISINGKPQTKFNFPLQTGDDVTFGLGKPVYEFRHPKIKIVFEDNDLIVIEKSEGLLAVATDGGRDEMTAFGILSDFLRRKDPRNRLFVVHRIDRETSGLIMYAKTRKAQLTLQDNWYENVTERVYIAVVEGVPAKEEDTIFSYLRESKACKVYSSKINNGGKEAVTHYRILRKNKQYAMLKVELDTGRKNQIRVHMQEIGHPIIGDKKYGAGISPIGRIGLHAAVLAFVHPITGESMRFETSIPRKFSGLF